MKATTPPPGAGDRLGVLVSTVCAVHCALLPVLLVLLPAVGVALGDERVEWSLLLLAGLIAGWSLGRGYRHHRALPVLLSLVTGLGLLLVARGIEQFSERIGLAALVSVSGAGFLIAGHVQNLKLNRAARRATRLSAGI